MTDRPRTLREFYESQLDDAISKLQNVEKALETLISGGAASYSLGNRSVTYNNISELKTLKSELEQEITELYARLGGRPVRCTTVNSYLCPSTVFRRR